MRMALNHNIRSLRNISQKINIVKNKIDIQFLQQCQNRRVSVKCRPFFLNDLRRLENFSEYGIQSQY